MRTTLSPVLVVAGARLAVMALTLVVRRVSPGSPVLDGLMWVVAFAVPVIAAGFLVGLFQRRLHEADALRRLGARARGGLSRGDVTAVVRDAVGDDTLRIHYPDDPAVPLPEPGRCLSDVREGHRLMARVDYDEALRDQRDFVQAVAFVALTAVENQRLAAQVASSLDEVRESRARILTSGDEERKRIERDLHDGAQQRLVALGIQLELTEELTRRDPERGLKKLHALGGEVARTLEEIQALARGVYPSVLADRGLGAALRAAARRLPIQATVSQDGVGRYPAEVENAVYFCCLEAMQNASKHARDASAITIELGEEDGLTFAVRDDGEGFDRREVPAGAGLTNMHDRLAAVGGAVLIRSAPGQGTAVTGRIPLGD
jgi:signal transduction histidine kinase